MKAILLISSGIDSVVAGHLMRKQGIELIGLHFPMGDNRKLEKAVKLMKLIKLKGLYAADITAYHDQITIRCNRRYQCILCKRMMARAAEALASEHGCSFIVTGGNLGQVASQTLHNIILEDMAVSIPVIRPLLCFDKVETIAIARSIGSYKISIGSESGCPYLPGNPATKAAPEIIRKEEEKLDIGRQLTRIMNSVRRVDDN